MTSEQARGRVYMLVFIGTLLTFDVLVKGLLLLGGMFRWSQFVGTAITVAACWLLWRGSKAAYGFLLFCIALGIVYAIVVASKLPTIWVVVFFAVLTTLSLTLIAPATRSFASYQQQAMAQQGAAGDARA